MAPTWDKWKGTPCGNNWIKQNCTPQPGFQSFFGRVLRQVKRELAGVRYWQPLGASSVLPNDEALAKTLGWQRTATPRKGQQYHLVFRIKILNYLPEPSYDL